MTQWLNRTALILGDEKLEKLRNSRVAVLGLGGVGGAAAEALCRAGIGHLMLVDHDTVDITNLNRQLLATMETLGQKKTIVAAQRLLSISPSLSLTPEDRFYLPEESDFLYDFAPDYVVDAIDTVTAKLHLATSCKARGIPLITCLGTGNRLDPSQLRVGTIADTAGSGCPLARVMRRELKKCGIYGQQVVFSTEMPIKSIASPDSPPGRHSPGSISFVPPSAGYLMASVVVRQLCGL